MGQSQTTLNVINDNTLAASLSVKGKAATVELESYCERYGVAERSLFIYIRSVQIQSHHPPPGLFKRALRLQRHMFGRCRKREG